MAQKLIQILELVYTHENKCSFFFTIWCELCNISVIFLFSFFSDRRTLKFLQVKCNPKNKKGLPYFPPFVCIHQVVKFLKCAKTHLVPA